MRFNKDSRCDLGIGVRKNIKGSKYHSSLSFEGKTYTETGFVSPKEASDSYFNKKLELLNQILDEESDRMDNRVVEQLRGLEVDDLRIYAGEIASVNNSAALDRYAKVMERSLLVEVAQNNLLIEENMKLSKILKDRNLYHLILEE